MPRGRIVTAFGGHRRWRGPAGCGEMPPSYNNLICNGGKLPTPQDFASLNLRGRLQDFQSFALPLSYPGELLSRHFLRDSVLGFTITFGDMAQPVLRRCRGAINCAPTTPLDPLSYLRLFSASPAKSRQSRQGGTTHSLPCLPAIAIAVDQT